MAESNASRETESRIERFVRWFGHLASLAMIAMVWLWAYWSAGEMYHEGWWGSWTNRVVYLAPLAITLLPTLLAFRFPLAGGVVIAFVGIFAAFFFSGPATILAVGIAALGAAFIAEGFMRRRRYGPRRPATGPWWRRQWRYILAIGGPILIFAGVSSVMLPVVLSRQDDGDRSVRRIEGNGVDLIWAPEGPGWNWRQSWGGFPSWHAIALYGVPPIGMDDKPGYGHLEDGEIAYADQQDMQRNNLCRYLDEDGLVLSQTAQEIWRMPTTDELVRSLGRHGQNAGCHWQGELGRQVDCRIRPDKESPLWATDQPAIYYWTADEQSESRGYFVAFNGTVNASYKLGGNPRHSHRCVREP